MSLVPTPNSNFLKVKCPDCENEMIIFNHAKSIISCNNDKCDHIIAQPQGGKAALDAEIIETLDNFDE